MHLDCDLGDAELGGDLLVHQPGGEKREHLLLACGQRLTAAAQRPRRRS